MSRFPSRHGARVAFDPVRSATPMPRSAVTPRSAVVPRAPAASREAVPRAPSIPHEMVEPAPKPKSPSFAEIDVVEANLKDDPRYDPE